MQKLLWTRPTIAKPEPYGAAVKSAEDDAGAAKLVKSRIMVQASIGVRFKHTRSKRK